MLVVNLFRFFSQRSLVSWVVRHGLNSDLLGQYKSGLNEDFISGDLFYEAKSIRKYH